MADVFISYKKEDRAHAERIAHGLADSDLSAWWDDDITPREDWDRTIEREIGAASAVVVLWSPRAVESDWVRREAHFGHDHRKLAPAMIERCELPFAFRLTQTVDLTGWTGEPNNRHWRKLLSWVADLRAQRSLAAGEAAPKPNKFRAQVGVLPTGEPVVDGAFVNLATPAGTVLRDTEHAPAMRVVPAGDFLLGSPAAEPDRANVEGPQKSIEIRRPFAVGVYPVLFGEYQQLMGAPPAPATTAPLQRRPSWFGRPAAAQTAALAADPAAPVAGVSFDDAEAYAARLSAMTGQSYRLPSEAEWEYACRGGSRSRFAWGDAIDATRARYKHGADAPTGPAPPGGFAPNRFGLYDMHGNVREWVGDIWHESYDSTPADGGPALEGQASMRVVRGGGWGDPGAMLRSAARGRATQSIRSQLIGFRLVRSLE